MEKGARVHNNTYISGDGLSNSGQWGRHRSLREREKRRNLLKFDAQYYKREAILCFKRIISRYQPQYPMDQEDWTKKYISTAMIMFSNFRLFPQAD